MNEKMLEAFILFCFGLNFFLDKENMNKSNERNHSSWICFRNSTGKSQWGRREQLSDAHTW